MGVGILRYKARTGMPRSGTNCIRFETAGAAANPDNLEDPAGFVSTVARASKNVYLITLKDKWPKLFAEANLVEAATQRARVSASVQGLTAANTVTVRVEDADMDIAGTESDNQTVQVRITVATQKGRVSP